MQWWFITPNKLLTKKRSEKIELSSETVTILFSIDCCILLCLTFFMVVLYESYFTLLHSINVLINRSLRRSLVFVGYISFILQPLFFRYLRNLLFRQFPQRNFEVL